MLTLQQVGGRDAGRVLPLERGTLDIGRSDSCELILADLDASRRHARIEVSATSIRLTDLDSTNGTFVDDVRVPAEGVALRTGAQIRIGDSTFEVVGPTETPAALTAAPDGTLRLLRPPRLDAPLAEHEIELPLPATTSRPRGIQWVAALLPALAGGAIAWIMHSPQFLLFALLSPLMMLSTSVGDRMHWRRSRRRAAATFAQRQAAGERAVAAALAAETTARRATAPDPAAVLRTCALPGSRLWERRRTDADFLNLRIGTGDLPSRARTRAGSVVAAAGTVRAVPVGVNLRAGPLGIAGPTDVATGVARWLVAQLAALHSPVDVTVTLLLSPPVAHRWQWARWLPHVANVATTSDEWLAVVGDLATLVETRVARRSHQPSSWRGPWHVVVIDAATELGDLSGVATLLARGDAAGISAVCLEDEEAALPSACRSIIRVNGETGTRGSVRHDAGSVDADVVLDQVSESWADAIARSLAPTVDASGSGIGALPDACDLLDLLELHECGTSEELRIVQRWSLRRGGADTVLGVGADGPLRIDLVGDGPHALVAGTTGAGKSELLQALVAGLAAQHPPGLLNFLLVDYKGGAAFAECAQLPHTVGLVTDLDSHLTERALRSLDSELRSRERRFAAAGAADLISYRSVAGVEPIPRLIIVVDEFATLAEELPDFIRGLVGVAQRGRSLGVHLVLATQRPGSAVSAEIRANTTMRIALRVTDPGESTDVIDTPEAASIERSRPERAYVRMGPTLVCFQSARTSGRPDGNAKIRVEPLGDWRRPTARLEGDVGPTDLARLVAVVSAAARRCRQRPTRTLWLEPLPDRIARHTLPVSDTSTLVPYGWIDLPAEQRRDVLGIDLAVGSAVLAVGAAGSGRSGLLASIALGCADRLSADDLHIYGVDPAGGLADALSPLPHCATVLGPDEVSITPSLLRRLERTVGRSAAAAGARRARPASLLLIDDWETVMATLHDADAIECADALAALQRSVVAGRLTVLVTGDRTLLAPRFAAGFDERLLFRLADRNDFGLAGVSPRDAPHTMPPGRAVRASDGA
ncbi:MAG TPA: FtsK/SpoIIIE domain-containing protein, partial [Jatrophihabitans sp.]|nr:FtsK/SpoIIIE domain-containing protein [Jatrophihabitans sp.]